MLNKLVYPVDTKTGYMTAPLIRMTLGSVLEEQPGYISSINMDLSDFSWDIDSELTQAVKLTISFDILEKNFITQRNANPLLGTDLFANAYVGNQLNAYVSNTDFSANINLPEINLNPTNDPLSQESLRADIQSTLQQRTDRLAKEAIRGADRINNLLSRA